MRLLPAGASLLFLPLWQSVAQSDPQQQLSSYSKGDLIAVECLNRSIDTGEHIQDSKTGKLQYIPFAQCNETKSPLQLRFLGHEDAGTAPGLNCTILSVSDEMYHLLEFYVHHDSPLSCRVRARPAAAAVEEVQVAEEGDAGSGGPQWVPLIVALAGKLEKSHLHINTNLNLLVHLSKGGGVIDSAAAYSTSSASSSTSTRIVIGDPLPLHFHVRWYHSTDLPLGGGGGGSGSGGGEHTLLYCVLSALAGAGACYAWLVRGPRRMLRGGNGANGGIIGAAVTAAAEKGRGYGFPPSASGGGGGYGYGYGAGAGGKRRD